MRIELRKADGGSFGTDAMRLSLIIFICFFFASRALAESEGEYILEQKVAVGFKPEKAALIFEENLGELRIAQASIQEAQGGAEYLFASSLDKTFSGKTLSYSFFILAGKDNFAGTEIAKKEPSLLDRELASIEEYEKELSELEQSLDIQKENLSKLEQNIEIVSDRIAVMTGTKSLVDLEKLVGKREEYRARKELEITRLKTLVVNSENLREPEDVEEVRAELDTQLHMAALATVGVYLERERRKPKSEVVIKKRELSVEDLRRLEAELNALRKKRAVLEEALRE